jgi:hypothetical protein
MQVCYDRQTLEIFRSEDERKLTALPHRKELAIQFRRVSIA